MIIFGSRVVHLKSIQSESAICQSCRTQGSLTISVFRKHAHIFWIPLFPIGKKGVSQCQHCKHAIEAKEMPENVKAEYKNLKSVAKGPIWQFAGLSIFIGLVIMATVLGKKDRELDLKYIETPVIGDVYEYNVDRGQYSTLKVIGVSNDSVFVSPNEYETNKKTGVKKIDKDENYSEAIYGIAKERLNEMYGNREIYDVNRK